MIDFLHVVPEAGIFIWDTRKAAINIYRHGISFKNAVLVFADPERMMSIDDLHSADEMRHFCVGMVNGRVVTVRFTYREEKIRVIGAGYWRKGRRLYEKKKMERP